MEKLNPKLLAFFTKHYKPGIIGLVGTNDAIGLAIRKAQSSVTIDGKASLWSHCFIVGELRLNRKGPGNTRTRSPYIFENSLEVAPSKLLLRNGAQENWIGKWCKETVKNAAIIDFSLTDEERDNVLATALQLVDEQVQYPIQELLGTWLAIIMGRKWLPNPLDDPHAMYCSAFVRYCYKEAGRDFIKSDVSISNTKPEDIAQAGIKTGTMKIYKP